MPLRSVISDTVGQTLYSVNVYSGGYFDHYNPNSEFEKWAAMEVNHVYTLPEGMEALILQPGVYAVFHYKGNSNNHVIYRYIYTDWLPRSGFVLDGRPHFEMLGEKYKNSSADSEEDIFIPIRRPG